MTIQNQALDKDPKEADLSSFVTVSTRSESVESSPSSSSSSPPSEPLLDLRGSVLSQDLPMQHLMRNDRSAQDKYATAVLPLQQARPRPRNPNDAYSLNTTSFQVSFGSRTGSDSLCISSSFAPTEDTASGCTCKRSKCLKLYCQCFASSSLCHATKCRCTACRNIPAHEEDIRQARSAILCRNPRAFETKFQPRPTSVATASKGMTHCSTTLDPMDAGARDAISTNAVMAHPLTVTNFNPNIISNRTSTNTYPSFHRRHMLGSLPFDMTAPYPSRAPDSQLYPQLHSHPPHTNVVPSDPDKNKVLLFSRNGYPYLTSTSKMNHPHGNSFLSSSKHSSAATIVPPSSSQTSLSHRSGCKCKKSSCVKKYCECFQMGAKCSSVCRCEDCHNRPSEGVTPPEDAPSSNGAVIMLNPTNRNTTRTVQDRKTASFQFDSPSYFPMPPSNMPSYVDFPFRNQGPPPHVHQYRRDGENPQGNHPNTGVLPNDPIHIKNTFHSDKISDNHPWINTETSLSDDKGKNSMSSFNALSAAAFMVKSTNPLDMMAALAMTELACGVRATVNNSSSTGNSTCLDPKESTRKRDHDCMDLNQTPLKNHDTQSAMEKYIANDDDIPPHKVRIEDGRSFESSSSSIENEPPTRPSKTNFRNNLPKSLTFRSICSKCGRPRKDHGEMWFGGQCKMSSCGKCGVSMKDHEKKGVSPGWNCSLTESDGASITIMKNYLMCIDTLAMTAALKKTVHNHFIYR